jgi:hypothetical protein
MESRELVRWQSTFQLFDLRSWLIVIIGTIVSLVIIGIPTAIIDNPFFVRMTPVQTQDYFVWVMTGCLVGLIAGTSTLMTKTQSNGTIVAGGIRSFLSVGCPMCNKLVLLLLGTSGALTHFAPAQLYIGIASLVLLSWALYPRLQAINKSYCSHE